MHLTWWFLLLVSSSQIPEVTANAPMQANDDYFRYILFPYAAAAFSPTPMECLNKFNIHLTFGLNWSTKCTTFDGDDGTCSGYALYDGFHESYIISFDGSTASSQLVDEGIYSATMTDLGIANASVSDYFYAVYNHSYPKTQVQNWIRSRTGNEKPKNCTFTGYSLGASVASIAAFEAAVDGTLCAKVNLMGLGVPRTGNSGFAKFLDENVAIRARITNVWDPVPSLPPRNYTLNGYIHYSHEYFYENGMAKRPPRTCLGNEDPTCTNAYFNPFIPNKALIIEHEKAHLSYFSTTTVEKFGLENCPFADFLSPSEIEFDMARFKWNSKSQEFSGHVFLGIPPRSANISLKLPFDRFRIVESSDYRPSLSSTFSTKNKNQGSDIIHLPGKPLRLSIENQDNADSEKEEEDYLRMEKAAIWKIANNDMHDDLVLAHFKSSPCGEIVKHLEKNDLFDWTKDKGASGSNFDDGTLEDWANLCFIIDENHIGFAHKVD